MVPLPLSPLDLPHIVKVITESFSFDDLLNCIRVNWAWHNAFIPVLWADIVTFRTSEAKTRHSYNSPVFHQALIKHSHHIRGLTCSNAAMPALLESSLDSLLEINFVAAPAARGQPPQVPPSPWDDLARLVAKCSNLHALSIEDVDAFKDEDQYAIERLIRSLDSSPSVTCLFLSFKFVHSHPAIEPLMQRILRHRLERLRSSNITSLTVKRYYEMTRSRRGLPAVSGSGRQCRWPGRERPLERWVKGNLALQILPSTSHGRFEHEDRKGRREQSMNVVAVLENNGVLELCLPNEYENGLTRAILNRFPALTKLCISDDHNMAPLGQLALLPLLPTSLPQLKEFGWQSFAQVCTNQEELLKRFLKDERLHLRSVSLQGMTTEMYQEIVWPLIVPGPNPLTSTHFLRGALVTLTLDSVNGLPWEHFLDLVTNCASLQTVAMRNVIIEEETEYVADHRWICQGLRSLKMGLQLLNREVLRENSSTAKISCDFVKQLGALTQLHDLRLGVFELLGSWECLTWPFFHLAVGVENGLLEQLSGLSQLEDVKFSGIFHRAGVIEMNWMVKHWPRLRKIELPVFHQLDAEAQDSILANVSYGEIIPLDFGALNPYVRVIVPA
ncbi:hypothetical protein BGZ92_008849, partial [Podila epicladia]